MYCTHCKQDQEIVYGNGWCRECTRNYYRAHKDKIAERKRAYRQANREQIAERKRAYRQANREQIAERKRAYYQAHREQIAEQKRAYRQAQSGMTDVLQMERELGIMRMSGTCQVCGRKITRKSKYRSYCSYTCYRQAFEKYRRTA